MNSNTEKNVRLVGAGLVPAHIKGKTQRGITLIALVITIIVLLILAGVTISMVLRRWRNNPKCTASKNSE